MNLTDKGIFSEPCPNCRFELHYKFTMTSKGPFPAAGAVTLCVACAEPLAFNLDLHLRKASGAELGAMGLEARQGFEAMRRSIQAAIEKRKRAAKA